MDESLFQVIADEIIPLIQHNWDRLCFYASYTNSSYSMKFYYKVGEVYYDCFKSCDKDSTLCAFSNIDKYIYPIYTELKSKDKWTMLTFVISSDMSFKADFDYSDFSGNSIAYIQEWKKKYLL